MQQVKYSGNKMQCLTLLTSKITNSIWIDPMTQRGSGFILIVRCNRMQGGKCVDVSVRGNWAQCHWGTRLHKTQNRIVPKQNICLRWPPYFPKHHRTLKMWKRRTFPYWVTDGESSPFIWFLWCSSHLSLAIILHLTQRPNLVSDMQDRKLSN